MKQGQMLNELKKMNFFSDVKSNHPRVCFVAAVAVYCNCSVSGRRTNIEVSL